MSEERKGLWRGLSINGINISAPWEISPGGIGECDLNLFAQKQFYDTSNRYFLDYITISKSQKDICPVIQPAWWKLSFSCDLSSTPLLLDLTGMTRGLIWLNSKCVGRYWGIDSINYGDFKLGDPTIQVAKMGSLSQVYYHLPAEWLAKRNTLLIFDEKGATPTKIKLLQRGIVSRIKKASNSNIKKGNNRK